jgi:hypothetical protein
MDDKGDMRMRAIAELALAVEKRCLTTSVFRRNSGSPL